MLTELVEASRRAMAQVGCDETCGCGSRVAYAAWLRLHDRIGDGGYRWTYDVEQVLTELEHKAAETFGHTPRPCPQSVPMPSWRTYPRCSA